MSDMLKRIDERLEFHREIDSHKSDVAFFEAVKRHIEELEALKGELLICENALSNALDKLRGSRQHRVEVKIDG